MAIALSKNRKAVKFDVVIKAKAKATKIVDITTNETVRVEGEKH